MKLTERELIERGIRAQAFLEHEVVQQTLKDLVGQYTDAIFTTAADKPEERERIYYAYHGLNDLISQLQFYIAAKNEAEAAIKARENSEGIDY